MIASCVVKGRAYKKEKARSKWWKRLRPREKELSETDDACFVFFCDSFSLLLLRVELFPESNTQFLTETVKALEILLVLILVLDLGLDTCLIAKKN